VRGKVIERIVIDNTDYVEVDIRFRTAHHSASL
jgi:hypothetical protein